MPLVEPHSDEVALHVPAMANLYGMSRRLTTPHTLHPRTHLLASGPYSVMLTNGVLLVIDPQSTNYPTRFYRVIER